MCNSIDIIKQKDHDVINRSKNRSDKRIPILYDRVKKTKK